MHQFGFIPANALTQLELEAGEYLPCDVVSMGIISFSLKEVIESFEAQVVKATLIQMLPSHIFVPNLPTPSHRVIATAKRKPHPVIFDMSFQPMKQDGQRKKAKSSIKATQSQEDNNRFLCLGITNSTIFTSKRRIPHAATASI